MEWSLFAGVINLCLWLVISWLYFVRLKMPFYHPVSVYLAYHLLGFVLRPFYIYKNGGSELWFRIGILPDGWDLIYSGLISSLALISFALIPLIVRGNFKEYRVIPPFKLEVSNERIFFAVVIFFFALGVYGTYKAYGGAGFSSVYAYEVDIIASGGQALKGVSGYSTALAEFIPVTLVILMLVKGPRSLLFVSLLIMFIAIRMWIGSQRLSFVVVLLALAVYLVILSRRRFPPIKFIVVGLLFLTIFDFIGSDRLAFRKIAAGEEGAAALYEVYQANRGEEGLLSDFKEFDVTTVIYSIVPSKTGFNYGSQYLRLFVWPIPRQIWPDKPIFTDRIDLNSYGNFWALTWSSHGDYYSNLGIPSLVILMALVSILLQLLYRNAVHANKAVHVISYFIVLMYMKTIFRDGGVTVFYFLIFSFIPASAVLLLCKPRLVFYER